VAKIFEEHGGGLELLDNPDGGQGAMVRLIMAIDEPADNAVISNGTEATKSPTTTDVLDSSMQSTKVTP
jgi:hypothetical protein